MTAVMLLQLVVSVLGRRRDGLPWGRAAALLGLLGGLVAMACAAVALVAWGVTDSGGRAGFGWAALALAITATVSASLVREQPRLTVVGLVTGSSLGLAAISLFNISTFYVVSLPLGWIAAALALLSRRPVSKGGLARE
jgi:hypothetical protein